MMNRPAIMGILNVTPDSFSGDGKKTVQAAVEHAKTLVRAGADILDIGAESTRPGAKKLTADQEWEHLEPVLEGILAQHWRPDVRLSVDTYHAQTAERAVGMGVEIINDVSGLADKEMAELLAEHECDLVVMHALGLPADPKQILPADCDVIAELLHWKTWIIATAREYNIAPERLIFDPGIGFGKTAKQSLTLMLNADKLKASGGRWLFGHSRKSFLKLFTDKDAAERDELTLVFSAQLAQAGIDYLRVHEVTRHMALFERLCT